VPSNDTAAAPAVVANSSSPAGVALDPQSRVLCVRRCRAATTRAPLTFSLVTRYWADPADDAVYAMPYDAGGALAPGAAVTVVPFAVDKPFDLVWEVLPSRLWVSDWGSNSIAHVRLGPDAAGRRTVAASAKAVAVDGALGFSVRGFALSADAVPTPVPTPGPTTVPTAGPTPVPTTVPTPVPTTVPTAVPTGVPTGVPTSVPTPAPTSVPTPAPTLSVAPTVLPSPGPSLVPTVSPQPTPAPSVSPRPTPGPSPSPTSSPPTHAPTAYRLPEEETLVLVFLALAFVAAVGIGVPGGIALAKHYKVGKKVKKKASALVGCFRVLTCTRGVRRG